MPTVQPVDLLLTDGDDRTCVFESDPLQIMRVRLAPGEALPTHNANTNAVLLPLSGAVRLQTPESDHTFGAGQAVSVPGGTQMDVSNAGSEPALLLILKAPHPKHFTA